MKQNKFLSALRALLLTALLLCVVLPMTAAAEGEQVSEFVKVQINYVRYDYTTDANGNQVLNSGVQAFTPYIATLKRGTAEDPTKLNTTVPNPTLVGYDAFLDDATEKCTSVKIALDNVTEDVTYTIHYRPAMVPYTVRYFFQNIYDDLYVEDADMKITTEGYTGTTPLDDLMEKEKDGFTSLYYQPDFIAADGSTVFEVYYERNYYLMEFDCGEGYGAETLYSRYGSYISVPTPVRPGYLFAGWDLVKSDEKGKEITKGDGKADALPLEMPHYNTAYQALWTTASTKYTIVYWAENADDNNYSYWGTASADSTSATQIVPLEVAKLAANSAQSKGLTDAAYFTLNEAMTAAENPATVIIEGDGSTFINVFYYRKSYTITFKAPGKCTLEEHTHGTNCEGRLICGQELHTHDASCNPQLTCVLEEHSAHSAECIICGAEEHTHGSGCCGQNEHPAHTAISCYTTQNPSIVSGDHVGRVNNITNPVAGSVYKYRVSEWNQQTQTTYYNYFYDGTNWYFLGTGNSYSGIGGVDISNPNQNGRYNRDSNLTVICNTPIHTHGDGNCTCETPVHTHETACYKDSLHTHSESCYTYSCSGSGHTHTESCYSTCLKPAHKHGTNCNSSSETNTIHVVVQKYDSSIANVWESAPIKTYLDNGIVWRSSLTSKYYSFLEKMPNSDITMTATQWSGNIYTWYYYLEVSPYEDTTGLTTRTNGGKTYKLYHTTSVKGNGLSLTYEEDYFPITGYDQRDSTVPSFSNGTAYLYYTLNSHTLSFYNYNEESQAPASQTLVFDQPISLFQVSKEVMERDYYPSGLEPNAYEFAGWYTSPGCYPGSEVDWTNDKMPDRDKEVYAKWTPILRNVTFYTLYSDMVSNGTPFLEAKNVPHGSLLESAYNQKPTLGDNDKYRFIGWFYLDEDNKKRFAPDSMEITRDLELFAEWSTSIDTTYKVEYVLADDVSEENTPSHTAYPKGDAVATVTMGHSSAGKTKTFTAKGLGDLYPDFQKNFYPMTNSHSILMTEDGAKNTYTFEYVYDDMVYYTVRYLDFATRTELRPSVVKKSESGEAIVTEKFLPIENYMPQNYFIRKALAYDGNATQSNPIEENTITFYYIRDEEHGMYSVEHYRENADSTDSTNLANYSLYESVVGSQDKNTLYTAAVRTYDGYTHRPEYNTVITYTTDGEEDKKTVGVKDDKNQPYGVVDYTGLTIKIYYSRNKYPYYIEYRESGTEKLLQEVESGTKMFDATVEHTADEQLIIDGVVYEYYLANSTTEDRTKEMTVRSFTIEDDDTPEEIYANCPNKMIFYYVQKKVVVHYEGRCVDLPADTDIQFGGPVFSIEYASPSDNLVGTDIWNASGFEFVGWYTDEACTQKATEAWDGDTAKTSLRPVIQDNTVDHVYYYALFRPVTRDLTITKQGAPTGCTDTFLFRVTGTNALGKTVDLIVSVQGNGSVTIKDLYCGTYTVTELTNWSWTYLCTVPAQTETLTVDHADPKTVTFTNTHQQPDWLHGETHKENAFNEAE